MILIDTSAGVDCSNNYKFFMGKMIHNVSVSQIDMRWFKDFCFKKKQSTMRSLLMVFIVHTIYHTTYKVVIAAPSNSPNASSNQLKRQVTLADAKKEAFEDTQSALKNFAIFIDQFFDKAPDNTLRITDKKSQIVIHQDQVNVLNSEYADWGGLDDLPLCSNKTETNRTMCIETESREITSSLGFPGNTTFPKTKHRQRRTRELEPILERQRRYSANFIKYIKTLPADMRVKLYKVPAKKQPAVERMTPERRRKFLATVGKGKQTKTKAITKKKINNTKRKKKIVVDLGSQENVNRLHGFPEQLKEQKKRIKKHKELYWQLDKYHWCMKNKVKWSKQPWKNLKLFYRAAGEHVRLPCNVW